MASSAIHSTPQLTVETTLSARRVEPGRTITLKGAKRVEPPRIITINDVGSGGEVVNGDRLQLMIRTSQDAYLYLVYCSQHDGDSGFEGMSLFPHEGGQRLAANAMTTVPPTGAIVVDDKPGQETLYVIVSRDELSRADARLADNLKNAQQSSPAGDCTTKLQTQPPRSPRLNTPRRPPKVPPPPVEPGGPPARADSEAALPRGYPGPDLGPPAVHTERGIDVVLDDDQTGLPRQGVVADASGIAVVRFDLQHVSPR